MRPESEASLYSCKRGQLAKHPRPDTEGRTSYVRLTVGFGQSYQTRIRVIGRRLRIGGRSLETAR
jgi:hypothetical protein